jgi:signal transduction histidine kinase
LGASTRTTPRLEGRGADGAGGWLASACRLILNVRAGILIVTLLSLSQKEHRGLTVAAILVAGIASLVPVLRWDQVGPAIVRHPSYLAGELVLAALILILTGPDSPFFFFTLGTALLGGLVYGYPGAGLFSVMLIVGYAYAIHLRAPFDSTLLDFRTVVVLPALYPLVAVAGAGARRLLDRQAEAEDALADQERTMAAQAERERLARDMHDSLAKTVHGIGFAALALSRRIQVDPPGAVEDARRLAVDARTAAQEARELLSGLRGRDDAELPLPIAIRSEAARWGERTGTQVGGSLDDVGPLPSLALRELRWILKEALANVERYARATRVDVHLRRLGERVVLTVADDGVGFEAPDDPGTLEAMGSFGLAGMRERARLAGGGLSLESEPGDGCVVSVWIPAGAPARQRETAEPPPAAAAPSDSVRDGAVEGFTWQ